MVLDLAASAAVLYLALVYVQRWHEDLNRPRYIHLTRPGRAGRFTWNIVKTAAFVALGLSGIWL
jgi:hypothetical protein